MPSRRRKPSEHHAHAPCAPQAMLVPPPRARVASEAAARSRPILAKDLNRRRPRAIAELARASTRPGRSGRAWSSDGVTVRAPSAATGATERSGTRRGQTGEGPLHAPHARVHVRVCRHPRGLPFGRAVAALGVRARHNALGRLDGRPTSGGALAFRRNDPYEGGERSGHLHEDRPPLERISNAF